MTSPRRKVLILTYYWPPAGGPGVQRFLKFSKYLPEYGWEPIVICPEKGTYPYLDESLCSEVPADLQLIQTKTREPFAIYNRLRGSKEKTMAVGSGTEKNPGWFQRLASYIRANFFLPDARVGWVPYAVKAAEEVIAKQKIEAIISTGPPHSTHLAALQLHRKSNIPWLADFRDPWTTAYFIKALPRNENSKVKDKAQEQQVLKTAQAVSVVSAGLKKEFEMIRPSVQLLYNGYDESDLYSGEVTPSEFFSLEYIGNFKANQDLPPLWRVLAGLIKEDADFARRFRLILTGQVHAELIQGLHSAGLKEHLQIRPFVAHQEATRLMKQAGALLFIIPQSPGNELIITGKIFEYIACGNELLSIGPVQGEAARILKDCERAEMIDYSDEEKMKQQVREIFERWKQVRKASPDMKRIASYSRKGMTEELARILTEITKQ